MTALPLASVTSLPVRASKIPAQDRSLHDLDAELTLLLQRSADGDEEAFTALYDRTSGRTYGMVLRVLRDRAQAAEVTQEVYLQIWREAGRFERNQGTVFAWLMMIAHRRAVDRVRSAQTSSLRDGRYTAANRERDYDAVSEHVEATLQAARVRTALTQLSEGQREAITLAYFGGHTHVEIATLLNTPLGTIKTRIRDGLIRLRGNLGDLV